MDAVISGRSGMALLIEGHSLFSFDVDDLNTLVPRQQSDLPFLFGDASDLQILENLDLDQIKQQLELAYNSSRALDLFLILLDSELSADLRDDATQELETHFTDSQIIERVEYIMYARPLPASADISGAIERSDRLKTKAVLDVMQNLLKRQPIIREVYQAWDGIPVNAYGSDEQKAEFQSVTVREGLFRALIISYENGKASDFLVKASTKQAIQALPNYTEILQQWAAPFLSQAASPAQDEFEEDIRIESRGSKGQKRRNKSNRLPEFHGRGYQTSSTHIRKLEKIVGELEWAMKSLQIDDARVILERLRQRIEGQPSALSSLHVFAPRVLVSLAEATDFDESYLPLLKSLASDIQRSQSGMLSLSDWARIGIVNGMIEFYEGRHDKARSKLELSLYDVNRSKDADLMCTVRYYLARCYWREGDYTAGLEFLRQAKECDLQVEGSKRIALIEILEGYLLFLCDKIKEGGEVLEHAKEVLEGTSDKINLAIVRSFQGQFCRRAGKYDEALAHFRAADEIYKATEAPSLRKRARCLINIAVVLRLKALRMEKERRSAKEVDDHLSMSLRYLNEAETIYNITPERSRRNLSKCHYIRALLHIDYGEFTEARLEAKQAYHLGKEADDKIAMAKARIAQCMITLDEDSYEDPKQAYRFALEAVEYATQTQYNRVQARAFIWAGKSSLRPPLNNPKSAGDYWHKADELLAPEHNDYLREELDSLRSNIDAFDVLSNIDEANTKIDILVRGRWKDSSLDKIIQEIVIAVIRNNDGKPQEEIANSLQISAKQLRRIIMDTYEGKSQKEIADILQISAEQLWELMKKAG